MLLVLVLRPNGLFGRPSGGATVRPEFTPILLPVPGALFDLWNGLAKVARNVPSVYGVAAFACILLLLPLVASEYALGIVSLVLIWSIFAIGLNIMLGFGGLPSLGHALFFGVGAYLTAWSGVMGWPGYAGLLLSAICGVFAAAILSGVAMRTRQAQFLLVTLALAQVVWGVVFKWRSVTGGDDGFIHPQQFSLFKSFGHGTANYANVLLLFAIAFLAYWLFANSRLCRRVMGIRDNEMRMKTLGYDTGSISFVTYVISGAFGGLAGGTYAIYSGFVAPDLFGVYTSAKVLLMVILGVAGSFAAPFVGAFALIGLEEVLSGLTARWHTVLGCVYILVAMFMFGGIRIARFGSRSVRGGQPNG
jgi:branched-chain amino acid transport system permease protein